MLQRINELLKNQQNFSIETTLATRSYTRLVHRAQEQGYKVNLIYFWLSSPDLAANIHIQNDTKITFSIFICLVWTIGYWQIIAKHPV